MEHDIPFAAEVTAGLVSLLVIVLTGIAASIFKGDINTRSSMPSDRGHVDFSPLYDRLEIHERAIKACMKAHVDAHDRQAAQRVSSLSENLSRLHREKEIEDRAQFQRLEDKIDRLKS